MRKTPYPLELLETVASLFSLNIPLFTSRTDAPVEASARRSYVFKTYLQGDDIAIQHEDGTVTLTGTVSDESHTMLAREILASLPGVTGVQSRLKDNSEVPSANTDVRLTTKVRSILLFHQNVNGAETEVIAKNGTIILRGQAINAAQKNLMTEYARDVEGVKKVKNEMTVATIAQQAGEKKTGKRVSTSGESIDDASVTALVKTVLLYHRSTTALSITVETKDGVVKLEGTAGSWAEINQATKRVVDVPGVKMVFNNMTVTRIASMTN
jgi:hyperosmotically inducible periplasmic protein